MVGLRIVSLCIPCGELAAGVFGNITRRGMYSNSREGGILVRCSERVIKKGALQLPSFFACLRLYSTINLCVVLFFPLIIAMV